MTARRGVSHHYQHPSAAGAGASRKQRVYCCNDIMPMGDIAGSTSDSTAGLAVQLEVPPEAESDSFHYTSNVSQIIDVESLNYEVDERGMEWWEKLANFQLPWSCRKKGPKSRRRILNDVTFQVKSGQMLAVLGSSGRCSK